MSEEANLKDLTIVIPTLGLRNLDNILKAINSNIKPREILISVYEKNYRSVIKYTKHKNVKIIQNEIKGQVNQRIKGFKNVKTKFTLQLDDDCEIDNFSINNLINFIKKNNVKCAVAPVYFDKNNKGVHELKLNIFLKIKFFIIKFLRISKQNNNMMGTISKIGTNYGVDPFLMKSNFLNCEWLPGGCILHNTSDLVLSNYYPFEGKAIGEDLIHSYLLKKKNIQLFVIKNSICYTNNDLNEENKKSVNYIRFLIYYNKLVKNNSYFIFFLYRVFFFLRKLFL